MQRARRDALGRAKSFRTVELLEQASNLLASTRAELSTKVTPRSSRERRQEASQNLKRLADLLGKVSIAVKDIDSRPSTAREHQTGSVISRLLTQLEQQASSDSVATLITNFAIGRQMALHASHVLETQPRDKALDDHIAALRQHIDEMQRQTDDLVEMHRISELEEVNKG